MSGISLAQAQAQLDALLAAQSTNMLSVSINGRSVSYRSMSDIIDAITFWDRKVQSLTRAAAGQGGPAFRIADFRSRQ